MKRLILPLSVVLLSVLLSCQSDPTTATQEPAIRLEIEQITQGPQNHFFGYIGHVQNIPWNGSGRYLLSLRVGFHDRMPTADDAADTVSEGHLRSRQLLSRKAMGMPEMHRCFTLTSRSGVAGWPGPALIPLEWG